MSKTLKPLLLGEFKRLIEHGRDFNITAQETKNNKYALIAIDNTEANNVKAYFVRHNRTNKERIWRLDTLGNLLKECGIRKFEVRPVCA
ncbi:MULTISPECIES: hypothetical protein [unclassified Vibrio]|uniref:hypothetical protein n=1 Tax=Vibrio TaxID=662 RepID=UPI001267C810|nr:MULTISPECIES: hypothetical protein [unclassified Vibrio]QFT40066.1 hypothetical protein FIU99_27120 [Vibrio sp. THAF64]QGM38011.1 hypothetical protein GGC04_27325 [Vibrio sp. THAF191d]QGN73529.1 hypothetical protein GGC03_27450 [Vibrio sp. THAF191c]